MRRLRVVAVFAVVCGVAGLGSSPAGAGDPVSAVPGIPLGPQVSITVRGAEPAAVTAGSVHRVTARPGETVELSLAGVAYDSAGGVVTSSPIGSGHLATIPVLPRR